MKPLAIAVLQDAMVPLDRWLATELTGALKRPVARSLTRKAIVGGLVAVAGRIVREPGFMLRQGRSVLVRSFDWLPKRETAQKVKVLYEDDWLIAIGKPAGLLTHETKDVDRPSLTQLVERHVGRPVFVHHRLDAGTSGVVLFAKAPEANASLARSFALREVEKVYVAVVGRPPKDWPSELRIDTPIVISGNGSVRVGQAGVPAVTLVRVLERRPDRLLIEARPVTGRKHQIRVHLGSVGAAIVGDSRYGGAASPTGRLMLHAERIELQHPVTGVRLVVSSPRPGEFQPWHDRASKTKKSEDIRSNRPNPARQPGGAPRPEKPGPRSWPGVATPSRRRARTEGKRRKPVRGAARGSHR